MVERRGIQGGEVEIERLRVRWEERYIEGRVLDGGGVGWGRMQVIPRYFLPLPPPPLLL